MVLTEAVIGALAALLVERGFSQIKEEKGKNGIINITGLAPSGEKVTIVQLKNLTLASPQYDLLNIETTNTIKDVNNPNYELGNDSSEDKRIYAIAAVPVDLTTQQDALLEIWLNGKRLFPITDPVQGMLKGVNEINIPIPPNEGLQLKESEKLQVFLWNPNGVNVSVTFGVFIATKR